MRLFALILATLSQGIVPAAAYCSKPTAPYCAERYGRFDDENKFNSCRREMESYQSEVEDFISCNKREAQEAADKANREAQEAIDKAKRESQEATDAANRENNEALDEYNDAVNSFNNRANQ